MNWKALAIVLICLLVAENVLLYVSYRQLVKEEEKQLSCVYEICAEAEYGEYDSYYNTCTCYESDILGQLQPDKTIIMRD